MIQDARRIFKIKKNSNSLEKQLDEKQIIRETLLQNIQNCSYDSTVANSNHIVGKASFENINSLYDKSKMTSNKSDQIDDNDNQNNNEPESE